MNERLRRADFEPLPDLFPFEPHWFRHEGARLHYIDVGAGRPVVCCHGNPTWSFMYRNVLPSVAQRARGLALDYPGFGRSDHPPGYGYTPPEHAASLGAWFDALELDGAVLVLHDWGGPIGLSVALERPQRIAGLVLLNTWCWPPDAKLAAFSRLMGGDRLGRRLQLEHNAFATHVLRLGVHQRHRLTPAVRAAYRAPFPTQAMRQGTWVFPRAIRTCSDWLAQQEAALGRLRGVPVELVWGRRDPAFGSSRVLRRWRGIFPHAEVTHLPDASHYVAEDRPDAVVAAIGRVLDAAGD